jgi:hypothetical protein
MAYFLRAGNVEPGETTITRQPVCMYATVEALLEAAFSVRCHS